MNRKRIYISGAIEHHYIAERRQAFKAGAEFATRLRNPMN